MVKTIGGKTWFCCPVCGRKIHPVEPGARGVFAVCRQKRADGSRCTWSGEVNYPSKK